MNTHTLPLFFMVACTAEPEPSNPPAEPCDEASYRGLEVGDCAPDFSLPDRTGTAFTLSQQRGKVALVDISAVW